MSNDRAKRVLAYDERDNVANALEPLTSGDLIEVLGREIIVKSAIPLGHKIALTRIDVGDPVLKYGEPIGRSRLIIEPGEHVHTHNVESLFANWLAASSGEIYV
jgi:altronate hydrolase